MKPIYLDNAATTPLANEVVKTLKEELNNFLANPSSSHFLGKKAKVKILNAKKSIGDFFNIKPEEIIFTSGATEALNTCIKGFYNLLKKPHIITTDIEHPAVFNTIKHLEENGADVTYLKCPNGYPELKDIENAIQDNTKLFVFSYVNSETGIVSDIDNIANLAKENDIALIVDAAQALGKIDFNITDGISAMCFSGHKIHATSGIGFFYLNSKYKISPLLLGGTQEYKKRAGTENILGIIALKTAINILLKKQKEDILHLSKIQHHFENALKSKLNIKINGFDVKRSLIYLTLLF